MNGHRRDDLANDIDQGHPTLSPEADALAAEVSRLSTFNEREALGRELGDRAAESPSWGEWMRETDRYLAEFDPALVDEMKASLTTRRDRLRERALKRGWDVPAES
jgi:hypothetical protein